MEVPGWEATLSDGTLFQGGNIASWRDLKSLCDKKNLEVQSLKFEGKEVDDHPAAVSYFIIYDQVTTLFTKQRRTRIGFGSFRKNGKARVMWRVINSNMGEKDNGNYTEITPPKSAIWGQIAVNINRSISNEIEETKRISG